MPSSQKNTGNLNEEIRKLEAETRIAELTAQKTEFRLRTLEAEEKVRQIQLRRTRQLKSQQANK
ncbi:MAG TPA: hypothetical protein VMF67_05580 [Rhizomicrobium sp.]|nr:hypothetical protein [Rhizomicrobium sp.]